jgi:hypothetical protein
MFQSVRDEIALLESLFQKGENANLREAFPKPLKAQGCLDRVLLNRRLALLGPQRL